MKYLKSCHRKESHTMTFFIRLFTVCFIALFVGYIVMAHIAGMYTRRPDTIYMEIVYHVLRWSCWISSWMIDFVVKCQYLRTFCSYHCQCALSTLFTGQAVIVSLGDNKYSINFSLQGGHAGFLHG